MTAVRAVIFDKDGTLFDFAATWGAWARAVLHRLAETDGVAPETLAGALRYDLATGTFHNDSVVIAGTPQEVALALLPYLPRQSENSVVAILNAEAQDAPQAEVVPLRAYLTALRSTGLRLGVATNDAEAPARAHLDKSGVSDLFDFIAGFDSGHGGKPAPGQLLAFAAKFALPVDRIVMVGDSTHDLTAGRDAGMRTVGVLTGLADAATLSPLADIVLSDIGALPGWLAQQG